MDIKQLKYFVSVAKCKNFTRAAEMLMVTQPMLTRVIKQMEEELGVKLITRSSKHLEMTSVGEMFYDQTVDFLERYNSLYRCVEDMKSMKTGEVTISTPGVLLDVYFAKLLKAFYDKYPNINISIVEMGSKPTAQAVLHDQTDLGLVMLPIQNSHRFQKTVIVKNVCHMLVSKTHPFAKQKCVHVSQLKQERIMTFSHTATLHDVFIDYCEQEGFKPNLTYRSLMPHFTIEMISYGLCIGLLPYPIIEYYIIDGLVAVPLEPVLPWEIAVIHKKDRYQSHTATQMIQFIKEYFI